MINLLLGGPGAGKSYEAVVFHVLAAVQRGRMVVTNLPLNLEAFRALDPSYPALIELREKTLAAPPAKLTRDQLVNLPEVEATARKRWSERAFANPEDYASEWRDAGGHGPLYVVDECHFCIPNLRTQTAVEEWFSMHRHYNCDVLLITQSSRKISAAIRDLVQVCYKVRKAVALGKPNGYIRKVLDGVGGGEVSTTERKYQKQFFGLYRSHTQGFALEEQKADDVAPMLVHFNRFKWVFLAFTFGAVAWAYWPSHSKSTKTASKPQPIAKAPEAQPVAPTPSEPVKAPPAAEKPERAQADPVAVDEVPEPYASKALHLTGQLVSKARTLYTFAISANGGRIGDTTSEDLATMGYRWEPLTACAGTLRWKDKARAVTCDAPRAAAGSELMPVVLGIPTGSSPQEPPASRTPG